MNGSTSLAHVSEKWQNGPVDKKSTPGVVGSANYLARGPRHPGLSGVTDEKHCTTSLPVAAGGAPMNGLPWIRFDTTLPENPKILELVSRRGGAASAFVYCCGLAYAGRHGTDGFIPRSALSRLHGKKADAAALVDVGLWEDLETGWLVHDWAEYQQSSQTTEEVRAKQRAGSAKGNCRRWHKVGCECWKTTTNLRAIP